MHFELARRYDFSPEGYTLDFKVHWGNWPLRPEFIESTYFLYQATKVSRALCRGVKLRAFSALLRALTRALFLCPCLGWLWCVYVFGIFSDAQHSRTLLQDPFYLEVGKQMVDDLKQFAKVKCGYAAIQDVRKKSHEDKMDSFFLTETVSGVSCACAFDLSTAA
jgi:hypothetical protein